MSGDFYLAGRKLHLYHQAQDVYVGFLQVVDEGLVYRIGGLGHEGDDAAGLREALEGSVLAVDEADGDLAVLHLWLAADDHNVTVLDPGGVHAVASHPQAEILRAAVEVCVGVAFDVLLGVDGRAGGDAAQDGDALEVGEVDGGGVGGEGRGGGGFFFPA